MMPRFLFLLVALAPSLFAQDGGQLFTMYCSACHGADGKGGPGGAFPPLAGSPWVAGAPDLATKVILHGLHGPVEVSGKTYNLEMPPQGAMLPDDQIAAILTFVRTSFGNQGGPVTTEQVKTIRAASNDRKTAWTAAELLKLHPLPLEKTALTNLISQVYAGSWKSLPDFTGLKALNGEEEHDGIISLTDSTLKENFAMVWQGDFVAPENGEYTFILDADDAGRVIIDGKTVTEVKGIGPMNGSRAKQGKITLTRGPHKFRAEYLEFTGHEGIVIGWKGPGVKDWKWLTDTTGVSSAPTGPVILVEPVNGRPVIYRNFIAGTTARAIGVGFPGGFNLAYSADHLAPELLWTGAFINGAPKWLERGTANNPPAGENLVQLVKSRALPTEARFRGYKLDPNGNPTFATRIGDQTLLDSWHAESSTLIRKLSLSGPGASREILLSDQLPAKPAGAQDYQFGDNLHVHLEGASLQSQNGKTTIKLDPGQSATLTYRWK